MLLSELIGKRVINVNSATCEGIITGAYVHKTTHDCTYICLDNNVCISRDELFSVDEVITVLNSPSNDVNLENYYKITATQEVILVSGKRLGRVKDLVISGRGKKGELTLDKGVIKLKSILNASDNIITANPTYRVLNKAKEEPKHEIFALEGKTDYEVIIPEEIPSSTGSYDFLIGKKVKSEVSDINRSFVLMAGTLITERVIQNARRAGKLSDLVNKSK